MNDTTEPKTPGEIWKESDERILGSDKWQEAKSTADQVKQEQGPEHRFGHGHGSSEDLPEKPLEISPNFILGED